MCTKRLCLVLILLFCLSALGEAGFDGSVYAAYAPVYDESALSGMEVITFIEPSGLLLSAFADTCEISVSLDEAEDTPARLLESRVRGVNRYGSIINQTAVTACGFAGYSEGACVSYSYRSLRDTGSGDVFTVDMYAARVSAEYMLVASQTSWGKEAERERFSNSFIPSLSLRQRLISTACLAFLNACEQRDDGIYLTIDYCQIEYEKEFGLPYAVNDDPRQYTVKLSPDADVWLPNMRSALYTLERSEPDAAQISVAIEQYYNINQVEAIFTVLFGSNGEVVRLQHYNAL
jgi:hypothetical protein